jgi:hypothetical protein
MEQTTVLGEAFTRAGYRSPPDAAARLRQMMREAIRAGGGRADASRDYFIAALHREDDAALLWELFAPVQMPVISGLFTEVLQDMRVDRQIRDARDSGKANAPAPQGQRANAEPAATVGEGANISVPPGPFDIASSPASEVGADAVLPQGQANRAPASATEPATGAILRVPQGQNTGAPVPGAQQPSRLRYEASERLARRSILQTFRINGHPIGEATGAEARAWLKNQQRDGRFVSLLCYTVPDEVVIEKMVPDEEADRLYRIATQAGNA